MFDLDSFLKSVDPKKNIVVAYSGGGDSTALLHFCHELKQAKVITGSLSAIHVNHSISSDSQAWENHCSEFCGQRQIPLIIKKVIVESNGAGMESAARQLRYEAFEQELELSDQLLLAHHADDVAETVLFRLFRGTGVEGLQGPMPKRVLGKSWMLRPWLDVPKIDLSNYLEAHKLEYIEDESNQNNELDRNYIRNKILPIIANRWPKAAQKIQQTSGFAAQHSIVMESLLADKLGDAVRSSMLSRDLLLGLEGHVCEAAIRFWIKANDIAAPNQKILHEIMKAFIRSTPSTSTLVNWSRADEAQKGGVLTFVDGALTLNKK